MPANYTLPVFNVAVNIWRNGNPTSNPPDIVTIGNLCRGERNTSPFAKATGITTDIGGMWLLLPPATDIRDDKAPAGRDTAEVPAGTGRFYTVAWVDDAGLSFANEHRFASLIGLAPWPVPFPSGIVPPPPANWGFIAAQAFNNPVGVPVTINTSFAVPTNCVFVMMSVNTAAMLPTVTSTTGGIMAPVLTTAGIIVGAVFGIVAIYQWTAAAGVETVTITGATLNAFCHYWMTCPWATLDATQSAGPLGVPATINVAPPTVATTVDEILYGLFADGITGGVTWNTPLVDWSPGGVICLDGTSHPWLLGVGTLDSAGATPPNGVGVVTTGAGNEIDFSISEMAP